MIFSLRHCLKHSIIIIRRQYSAKIDVEYQFLQKSKIRSDYFQKSLPPLPVPKLENTCCLYSMALEPILNDKEYELEQIAIIDFMKNEGAKLQKILMNFKKTNKHTSYITEMWFDMYLRNRQSLPINFNPALIFQNDTINSSDYNNQVIRCTNLIISALRFYRSLNENILEPEVFFLNKKKDTQFYRQFMKFVPESIAWYVSYVLFNAFPLDMSQYSNLFCTTRIPKHEKDIIYQSAKSKSKHIVISSNGFMYKVDVLDNNGLILNPNDIYSSLLFVLNQSKLETNEYPCGMFTTAERNDWSEIREEIENVFESNKVSFEEIDSALFHVALDDIIIKDDLQLLVRNFLDGGFQQKMYKNRWFDKSVSLIVSQDGIAGLNFEHTWGDGVAVLRFFEDILKDSTENPKITPFTQCSPNSSNVTELKFVLNNNLKSKFEKVKNRYEKQCNDLDLNILQIENVGRSFCKTKNISPDALMQLAFQLAYYKLHKTFVPTYESCSTAAFKHGRTETIRPCTKYTKQYCLDSETKSKSHLRDLVEQCSKHHIKLTKSAAMGSGFDRHLFALNEMAKRHNIKSKFFEQNAYKIINQNILSTSSLSSNSVWAGGFGPVVNNGYGAAYTIRNDMLGAVITNYKSQTNGVEFVEKLSESFDHLKSVLSS